MLIRTLLVILEMVTASVWLGGLVCVAIVVRVSRRVLDESSQLALIRVLGRRYGVVGTISLLVAFVTYLLLLGRPSSWSIMCTTTVITWGFLILISWRAVIQARLTSALRRSVLETGSGSSASSTMLRSRKSANALRVVMGLTSMTVLVLVAVALAR